MQKVKKQLFTLPKKLLELQLIPTNILEINFLKNNFFFYYLCNASKHENGLRIKVNILISAIEAHRKNTFL